MTATRIPRLVLFVLTSWTHPMAVEAAPGRTPSRGAVGEPAPWFLAATQNPERCGISRVDLGRWVGDRAEARRPVALSFAASDCRPCWRELAALRDRAAQLEALGAALVVVVMDVTAEGQARMLEGLNAMNLSFPVIFDAPGLPLARSYGVSSLPHLVVVARDGTIQWTREGYRGEESLDALWTALEGGRFVNAP
ncbi:MAG: peroxiredoxin family protein [Myxococcota bacterium]